ncbi:hypothetical protein C5167_040926 [Papaver somniferum]|uniref:Uncharacterized protein n=1 Tax=Papaver somniferum TaxID=3469 RepID=A0A4Y7IJS9_PAPSO|nr:hypothetical protein C5167_040926 [Papaver somniferum]
MFGKMPDRINDIMTTWENASPNASAATAVSSSSFSNKAKVSRGKLSSFIYEAHRLRFCCIGWNWKMIFVAGHFFLFFCKGSFRR